MGTRAGGDRAARATPWPIVALHAARHAAVVQVEAGGDGGCVRIAVFGRRVVLRTSIHRHRAVVFIGDEGKPQLRLSKLAAKFRGTPQLSICDTDRYDDALDGIATAMTVALQASCTSELPQLKAGQPLCLVGDVDQSTPNAVPQSPFSMCSASCCQAWAQASTPSASDPAIVAACRGEAADACYCAVPSQAGACSAAAVAGVWRKPGTTPPEGTVVNFTCVKDGAQ
jgi:hypothetical protein